MIHRIEVAFKPGMTDALGNAVAHNITEDLGNSVESVRTVAVYSTNMSFSPDQLELLATELFIDPVTQHSSVDRPIEIQDDDFNWLVEVGYRPGVTDNVGHSAVQGMQDLLGVKPTDSEGFFTSRQYHIKADLSRDQVEHIVSDLLANDLIERWQIISRGDWDKGERIEAQVPVVRDSSAPQVGQYDLEVSDRELVELSEKGTLSLTLEEMKVIQEYYRREDVRKHRAENGLPECATDVELECIAQTWSEHCKHKIFNCTVRYSENGGQQETIKSLFKSYIKKATDVVGEKVDWLVSVFHDNAGIVKFDDDYNISIKVETHNSPSALDPYGGSITGIVGVNRDVMGTGIGCRMIFNTDVFCFAPPDWDETLPGRLLHPKRIFKGVHKGIIDGGNQSGIPTVNGAIVFDSRFRGKPLVFCGTGGIIPTKIKGKATEDKNINPGDRVIMVGGRIGKDGIHGATFSSVELDESSPASAVQIGDPITQKKMADCLIEARDQGLYNAITDNGAGGLSSSIGEMARMSGGALLELDRAPLKYQGLSPWEILVSEAQERMSLAVPQDKLEQFYKLCEKHEVEATDMGAFTDSGYFECRFDGKPVCLIEMDFLHEGLPPMELKAEWKRPENGEPEITLKDNDLNSALISVLGRYNVCSKEAIVRQYDHEVQALSVVKPFTGENCDGPSDSSVIRPVPSSMRGVAIGCGLAPRYSDIDTYNMTACSLDEAIRNVVAVGADPSRIAALDNFCWPDPVQSEKTPDGAYKMAQLVRSCRSLYDYCTAYGVPLVSGKDSMKNDYGSGKDKISIPPTLLVTVMGIVEDISKSVTMDAKNAGDLVYMVGDTFSELGGSEYFALNGFVGDSVPSVDAGRNIKTYSSIHKAIQKGLLASCHDLSDGGLGVSLAEVALAGNLGLDIDLGKVPGADRFQRDDYLLFSESQGRFVVTVRPENAESFEKMMSGIVFGKVGTVESTKKLVVGSLAGVDQKAVDEDIEVLRTAWKKPLDW